MSRKVLLLLSSATTLMLLGEVTAKASTIDLWSKSGSWAVAETITVAGNYTQITGWDPNTFVAVTAGGGLDSVSKSGPSSWTTQHLIADGSNIITAAANGDHLPSTGGGQMFFGKTDGSIWRYINYPDPVGTYSEQLRSGDPVYAAISGTQLIPDSMLGALSGGGFEQISYTGTWTKASLSVNGGEPQFISMTRDRGYSDQGYIGALAGGGLGELYAAGGSWYYNNLNGSTDHYLAVAPNNAGAGNQEAFAALANGGVDWAHATPQGWQLTPITTSGHYISLAANGLVADSFFALQIPEPGTLALLACGLISLLAYAWRKRK